jgi:hypothetical protein
MLESLGKDAGKKSPGKDAGKKEKLLTDMALP